MSIETTGQTTRGGLSWKQLLFTITGRATRFDYWVRFTLPYIAGLIVAGVLDAAIGTMDPKSGIGLFVVIYYLLGIWPSLAVSIKRCHDREHSGWFLLIGLIPIVCIWLLIELGFLRGTEGANRYGADPLGGLHPET
jgi:uncharacterized membrane protein YhaH (DUF805 family)